MKEWAECGNSTNRSRVTKMLEVNPKDPRVVGLCSNLISSYGIGGKGGGAALTREKIVAAVAREFICIADGSKWVDKLGKFPLPIEVIPMARSHVAQELVKLGGDPVWRNGVITDNGNHIIDIHSLWPINADGRLEKAVNQITGVVTNGLFSLRTADLVMLGTTEGVITCKYDANSEGRSSHQKLLTSRKQLS